MPTATCPECDADVNIDDDAEINDTLDCGECGAELQVTDSDPIVLEVVEDEPFDDDDEDDDEDDY